MGTAHAYAREAAKLVDLLLDWQKAHHTHLKTNRQIGDLLGIASASTVADLLSGKRRPRRSHAIQIAARLELRDRFEIARLYGYPEAGDDAAVTLPELIAYVERDESFADRRQDVITRLQRAAGMSDPYDRELVSEILARPWPLAVRAERIAQMVAVADAFRAGTLNGATSHMVQMSA